MTVPPKIARQKKKVPMKKIDTQRIRVANYSLQCVHTEKSQTNGTVTVLKTLSVRLHSITSEKILPMFRNVNLNKLKFLLHLKAPESFTAIHQVKLLLTEWHMHRSSCHGVIFRRGSWVKLTVLDTNLILFSMTRNHCSVLTVLIFCRLSHGNLAFVNFIFGVEQEMLSNWSYQVKKKRSHRAAHFKLLSSHGWVNEQQSLSHSAAKVGWLKRSKG